MDKITRAREILGDDFVIVGIDNWNASVDDYKRLVSENQQLQEDLETAYRANQQQAEVIKRLRANDAKNAKLLQQLSFKGSK